MSKIDGLTKAAAALPEDRLDGLIEFARSLAAEPFYNFAPQEAMRLSIVGTTIPGRA